MGRNFKPKHITDKTIEQKPVYSEVTHVKKIKPKTIYKYQKEINNNSEIELVHIDIDQVFEIWPWLLDDID